VCQSFPNPVAARSSRAGGTREKIGESKGFPLIPFCFFGFCFKKITSVFLDIYGYALTSRRLRDGYVKR
jgi:hypothetical protein